MTRLRAALPRPLDPFQSIKLKIGILVMASILAAMVVFRLGIGWLPPWTVATAVVVALVVTQLLAHGMTSPLREMTAAAQAMARGDYSRRVRTSSRDEVGELARAFNQMAADLGTVDRQRRELIANVSHELRTPITAVQAVLENIVDGVAPADPVALRAALAQTERLGRLVNELLDLSRIDAGVHRLDHARFPVADLLEEAVDGARVAAAAAGWAVRFEIEVHPAELIGYADRERLYQVLANLLDNAARHSPPGGTVRLSAAESAPGGLVLAVSDQGPGIPPAERRRVFERFTRGERASGGGTGLGLAIAHWIVELHGGSIAVVDQKGGSGCQIRVVLPPSRTTTIPALSSPDR